MQSNANRKFLCEIQDFFIPDSSKQKYILTKVDGMVSNLKMYIKREGGSAVHTKPVEKESKINVCVFRCRSVCVLRFLWFYNKKARPKELPKEHFFQMKRQATRMKKQPLT